MSWKKPTAGIVLAAGLSKRFGMPKQLLKLGGKTLIERVLGAALSSRLDRIILVLGHHSQAVLEQIVDRKADPRLSIGINPAYRNGMSHSLRLGLEMARADFPSVMFLLADQPLMNAAVIDSLLDRFWSSDKDICVPVCGGRRRNPTLFTRRFYSRILEIQGDTGAREIIRSHPESVQAVEMDDPLRFFDIDTPTDLDKLKSLVPEFGSAE
jgi:molybdenum cofactor cytidylyltransferase